METQLKRIDLRMPEPLYDQLVATANADTRSLNAEIVALLKEALKRRKDRDERLHHRLDG